MRLKLPDKMCPLVVYACNPTFDERTEMAILDITDNWGDHLYLKVSSSLMTDITAAFWRRRLFGLH